MVQAFSLTSESLRYFIGYTLVHARHVVVVSPWVSDVELRFPVTDRLAERHVSLLDALDQLRDTEVTLLVRAGEEEHNDFVRNRLPEHVTMVAVEGLHAKVVACDEYVYLGSANITRGGLSLNREVCEIVENEYRDAERYVEAELDVDPFDAP